MEDPMLTRAMPLGRALTRIIAIVEPAATIARWLTAREIPATVDDRPAAPVDVGWLVADLQLTDAQGLFGFWRDFDLLKDVIDHLTQRLGLVGVEKQGALRTSLDGHARTQALDRRYFAMR